MNLLILLLVLIIILTLVFKGSAEGAAELYQNKDSFIGKLVPHKFKNFTSFLEHKNLKEHRVILVNGVPGSGAKHLATMIADKFKHTLISDTRTTGNKKKVQEIRREFYIENAKPKDKKDRERMLGEKSKRRYVIYGNFNASDLKVLFKGRAQNKNFLLLMPVIKNKEVYQSRWIKKTKRSSEDFKKVISGTEKLISELKSKYRVNTVKNKLND